MTQRIQTDDLVREGEPREETARAQDAERPTRAEEAKKPPRAGDGEGTARAKDGKRATRAEDAERATPERDATSIDGALSQLFDERRAEELRGSWHELQSRFVDEPRETVQEADALVAELLQELARGFAEARSGLESQWSSGDDVSTEELRVTLRRYRSFFERLLAA